jgi:hypothetical protein
MPAALLSVPHFKVDGAGVSPNEALHALEHGTALGARIAALVDAGGVVALTKPNEARFRG